MKKGAKPLSEHLSVFHNQDAIVQQEIPMGFKWKRLNNAERTGQGPVNGGNCAILAK